MKYINLKHRYLLFIIEMFDTQGGLSDIEGTSDNFDELVHLARVFEGKDTKYVFDTETNTFHIWKANDIVDGYPMNRIGINEYWTNEPVVLSCPVLNHAIPFVNR